MNRKIRRVFSIILVACMLLSLVPLHATSLNEEEDSISNGLVVDDEELSTDSNAEESNTESLSPEQEISSSTVSSNDAEEIKTFNEMKSFLSSDSVEDAAEQQDILTMADEETEEPENDNWELGLVFYDSSVDNGKTPLTEINWDASDGGYGEGTSRIITVQINYKNTNAVTTYQPGELEISIPNLIYNTSSNTDNSPQWNTSVVVGANDLTHKGYDWDFITGKEPTNTQETYTFTNTNVIEEKSNFEGTIQIVYTITPMQEYPERYDDNCIHEFSKELKAELKDLISSNDININFIRNYVHPWEYVQYKVTKTASKISSYDDFPDNAPDYIWVKYVLRYTTNTTGFPFSYPLIGAKNLVFRDSLPEECIVLDENRKIITSENEIYNIPINSSSTKDTTIYVGYPKDVYKDDNMNITNTAKLYGTYSNETEEKYLAEGIENINLANFEFVYSGNLYSIGKMRYKSYEGRNLYYQDILKELNTVSWRLHPSAFYTGSPMTLKIGDDILYATNKEGNPEKLKDDDYFFSSISFNGYDFNNKNNTRIPTDKYDCEIWVRYKNDDEYVLYESFKNPLGIKSWTFSKEDGIVGFYFIVHDMREGLSGTELIWADMKFINKNIPQSGTLYNFDYLQVYFKDKDGKLIFQNAQQLNNYANFITKEEIAKFDKDTYGEYIQRDSASATWSYYNVPQATTNLLAQKKFNSIRQDAQEEKFFGSCDIAANIQGKENVDINYLEDYDSNYGVKGFKIYDLLPSGMELESTEEEISKSLIGSLKYGEIYDINNNQLVKSFNYTNQSFFLNLIDNTNVVIKNNWNGTGRTKIEITTTFKEPIYIFRYTTSGSANKNELIFNYTYNYSIPYDSFLTYGDIWENYCYSNKLDTQTMGMTPSGSCKDNGQYDRDAADINEDGDITDILAYAKAQTTINSVVSTHQDVTKYVQTDMSNYSTGTVESSYDSEYEYKLRVRTGQNDITNLVIYDSIEEYTQDKDGNIVPAYGTKNHWNGEFLGIDTSYAESKGYVVKPYYSENVLAGNLYNDDGSLNSDWKEYSDDWDEYEYGEPQTITSTNWPSNYNNSMTEEKNFWEVSIPDAESLEIRFDSTCKLESATYDYLRFYDKNGNNITSSVCGMSADKIGGTDMAGKIYIIPGDYVKITMRTDGSGVYKGFSADVVSKTFKETHYGTDKSKVKALAFEYLDADGNPAKLPANSLTYVLIKMKSPADENITSLAYNGCRTQWQALDDYDRPVDFITGINSNIVKVSLPNSVEDKEVNLSFNKIIDVTDEDFENLKLNKDDNYNFFISLTNQETGDIINGLLDSKEGFRVNNIPIGTYIIEEQNDIWFHFISMVLMEEIEGIDFKEENGAYVITVGASVESGVTAEICVTNKLNEERFYDSKYDIKNLFTPTI